MTKPLIVVTGATGLQGGSVVRFLARTGQFNLRGITRNIESSRARALKDNIPEIELVVADLDDVNSLEKAFDGAYGVFGVTDFWEHGYDGEVRQGKNLVDAAKTVGVQHFVYSTFVGEHSDVPHFDSKLEVDEYLKASGVPRTSLYTSFYFETPKTPQKTDDGNYVIQFAILPDAKLFLFSVEDTGAWVTAAFSDPKKWIGEDMRIATEWLSTREMAEIASHVSGEKVVPMELDEATFEATKKNGDPVSEELYRSKLYAINHPPSSKVRDIELSWKLFPEATSYEKYIQKYKDKLFPS